MPVGYASRASSPAPATVVEAGEGRPAKALLERPGGPHQLLYSNDHTPTEVLIDRLGLNGRGASDLLDALVALGMLERGSGAYANTAATDLFLDKNKQAYVEQGSLRELRENAELHGAE